MKRQLINENELDNITGGSFNFYNRDGLSLVYIDGFGTYYASSDTQNLIVQKLKEGESVGNIVNDMISQGLFH